MHLVAEAIENYIDQHTSNEDEVLATLNRQTQIDVLMPQMLSGKVQGKLLTMLSMMLQPKCILEIGTFTGYATICLAKGLQKDGKLITIDVNEELEDMVKLYVEKANLSSKIEMKIGDATTIIPTINETFDLVFIDADKKNYGNYYDLVFDKVRKGGFILVDNVLWSGKVVQENKDKDTLAIDLFNKKVAADNRVEVVILSVRDGISVIRKL
ncbi:MAG: class I SAM-dependent methyltransferase [Chitinophagales bacterium]|nr:class I SAM-dependent methyltransferase [Chitinophagales bacterium]